MFSTKLEVDKHVENCLKKINSESERNLRCIAFAKLYFKVGDYEQARRYVSIYLGAKPLSAEAQQLLGKVLEKQGKLEAALDAYRTSLEIDPKQNNVVIKVCELLANENVNFDASGARFFCERAQSIDPNNPLIYTLKEKLIMLEGKDPDDVSRLLQKELEARPTDIDLRVRLLRHLLQNNKVKEAYKHAYDIEHANLSIFVKNLKWYKTLAEVLVKYQQDNYSSRDLNWEFWMLLVFVLDKLVQLNLEETYTSKVPNEYVTTVFNFDQTLKIAADGVQNCPEKQLVQEFLNHYRGQLCFHLVTLMYKQAKKQLIKYKEAFQMCLPLLFVAYHIQPIDLQCLWINHTTERNKELIKRWNREASYRCSQVGHMLLSLSKDRKCTVIDKATQTSSGMWRDQFLKKVFITRDQQAKIKSSYFATCPQLVDLTLRLPEKDELSKFDESAQFVNPDSLHHYIWLGLNQDLPHYKLSVFEGLPYSLKNLSNCSAESLNILDIHAFLYCAILCTQQQIEDQKHSIYYSSDKPAVLPAVITSQLGTTHQMQWLISAYKMFKSDYGCNFSEVRLALIKGIETVRCVGNHGLDVKLLVLLAKIFADKAKSLEKQSEIEFNEARAEMYWKTALPLLEKLRNSQAIFYSPNRLFEYKSKEMSSSEILSYIEDGRLFTAIQYMKKKEYEKALHLFETLRDPYASYHLAQIYKMKAEEQTSKNKENVTSEMRSQNIILLSKARDCLYLTFDRLRDPSVSRKHSLNALLGTEIDKIERMLSRIDPDTCNRNECDGTSDENVSSAGSMDHNYSMGFLNGSNLTPRNDTLRMSTTPLRLDTTRREARPSPERLDAQLKQLLASRDTTLSHIMDQNKHMVESQKALLDAISTFTTNTIDEMRTLRTSIDELKHSICDMQSLTDQMSKMRKEIADLKKTSHKSKNADLTDEDLYALYEECNNELNANMPPLPQNFYPNMGKMTGNPLQYGAVAAAALYPGMYPMLPYQGVPLAQPGTLGYGPEAQLADYRNLTQGLPLSGPYTQTGYAQGSPLAQGLPQVGLSQSGLHAGLPQPGLQTGLSQPGLQSALQQPQLPAGMPHTGLQAGLPQTVLQAALSQHLPQPGLTQPLLQPVTSTLSQISSSLMGQPSTLPSTSFSNINSTVTLPPTASNYSLSTQGSMPSFSVSSQTYLPNSITTSKAPPVNVVITSSDPLPLTNTNPQPVLSVTIPPQHLKGNQKSQPHNYQIQLPPVTTIVTPAVMSQSAPVIVTQSILSNVAPPIYSAIDKAPPKNSSLGFAIEKSLNESFGGGETEVSVDLNKSCISSTSLEEYDPCPDFKPVIPLPDEVPLNTGEENETVLFEERAKLYRFDQATKEWKERGVGVLKLLKNKDGKVRVLMRRDQIHKICANHFITKQMTITPRKDSDKAYFWAANDFADEEVVFEKLCVKFKTADEAHRFFTAFESAKGALRDNYNTSTNDQKLKSKPSETSTSTPKSEPIKPTVSSFGGFVFTSTPTFLPKDISTTKEIVKSEPIKSSPFASFSFTKTSASSTTNSFVSMPEFKPVAKENNKQETIHADNNDSHVEEYEPNVDFKPVIPLPELIDIKTGEESAEVLFDCKSKLMRFDTNAKEWKERGVGQMKILKFEDTIRFVMRREQVHKVCCNHQLLKNISFSFLPKNIKAISWYAQDYSEGVLQTELFALKFKYEEQAQEFLDIIKKAQDMLDDGNCIIKEVVEKKSEKKVKPDNEPKKETPSKQNLSWSDKHKPKHGSWECKVCYVINDGKDNYCAACDTPKNETVAKKVENSAQFSFGLKPNEIKFGSPFEMVQSKVESPVEDGWGNAFKPAADSWECQTCLIRNTKEKLYCESCETPKDDTVPKKEKGINLDTGGLTFSFGIPQNVSTTASNVPITIGQTTITPMPKPQQETGWGNAFKPPADSWECTACFVRNSQNVLFCISCQNPKHKAIPKTETNKSGNLETPALPFSFGIPSSTTNASTSFSFGIPTTQSSAFSFGNIQTLDSSKDNLSLPEKNLFSFSLKPEAKEDAKPNAQEFVFGSPTKHNFEFTPRSPRRQSSGPGEDESEGYVEEEEDNIYFKPVIPLPEKVDVKTGEEGEDTLYCHRAKLFRFTDGEWKERGLGDVKILKDRGTGKLRVVMRREQVLKICLNHMLTSEINYTSKDEKTWMFSAADFSEGEIQHRQFCLRFKTGDIAKEFHTALTNALGAESAESQKSDDSDVEIVYETTVTPEEEQEAIRLGLPPKFMAYRQMKDCTCEECKKDDIILKSILNKDDGKTKSASASSNVTVFGTPLSHTAQSDSVFETPLSEYVPTTPEAQKIKEVSQYSESPPTVTISKSETLKSLLVKPSLFNATKPTTHFSSPSLVNAATPKSNLFGTSVKGEEPVKEKPAFNFSFIGGDTAPTTSNIFASSKPSTPIFGSSSIFSATTQPSSQIFGSIFTGGSNNGIFSNTTTSGNIFGAMFNNNKTPDQSSTSSVTTIFQSPSANIFNNSVGNSDNSSSDKALNVPKSDGSQSTIKSKDAKSTNSSIFGAFQPTSTTFGGETIFGKSSFGANTQATLSFGAVTTTTTTTQPKEEKKSDDIPTPDSNLSFSALTKTSSDDKVFGQKSSVTAPTTTTTHPKEEKKFEGVVLTADANLSFSALAKSNIDNKPAFGQTSSGENPFAYLGAGTPVFASKAHARTKQHNEDDDGDDHEPSGAAEGDYDPHYEPIVPLPEAIVVSTGEEDEEVLFNERVKLYRYDKETKQWKERGIGQIKILHHPANFTYRMLLRREQVYKVVLNQLITAELDLQPMSTSDIAWCWYGYNFTEDGNNLEKLAAKFKNRNLSEQFYKTIQKAIDAVKDHQVNKNIPTTVTGFIEGGYEEHDESANEDCQEDDYDEDTYEDRSIMFRSDCVLSEETSPDQWTLVAAGEIMMCYDAEIFGARIHFTSDDVELSNTMIGMNTVMNLEGTSCTWRAVEWANQAFQWRKLQATFKDETLAETFRLSFLEGLDYAEQSDIVDNLPPLHIEGG